MRRAYFETGWLKDDSGKLLGLALGYDRCGEHECGVEGICSAFGLRVPEFPAGVSDRTVKTTSERLHFVEFKAKPRHDKRRKAFAAAMLLLAPRHWFAPFEPVVPTEVMKRAECSFDVDPGDRFYEARHDLVASYGRDGFCVLTRGDENIAQLKRVHEAFEKRDAAIAMPWSKAFYRGGLCFTLVSAMSDEWKAEVLSNDLAHKELHDAARATGIYDLLERNGKGFYALGPDWYDREAKGEVIFFLNPKDQRRYNHGWFTLDELKQWAADAGPVVKDAKLEAFAALPENYNYACRLLKGLNARGLGLRYHEKLVWFDDGKQVPGLLLRMSKGSDQSVLADGVHPFKELMERFAEPLPVEEKESC